ncbi:MAG: response regulator transcription factor [Dehalococcoidia bacterium]|nr:response regulator transcription factor [Dehalococcoidia bacterium]
MRILVIEDELRLANAVADGLRQEGMAVDVALDGDSGMEKAGANAYDVVLLDRDLPGVHGDDVCRELSASGNGPRILMLTASGSIDDRVTGLELGADDYLPKPFALRELVARVRTLARRPASNIPPRIEVAGLLVEPARRAASRDGRDLRLTRKEFGVLEVLAGEPGRVVTTEELLERVWDEETNPFTNTVRVTIMTLRRKLGDPPLIETVPGSGYILRMPDEPPVTPTPASQREGR